MSHSNTRACAVASRFHLSRSPSPFSQTWAPALAGKDFTHVRVRGTWHERGVGEKCSAVVVELLDVLVGAHGQCQLVDDHVRGIDRLPAHELNFEVPGVNLPVRTHHGLSSFRVQSLRI